MALDDFTDIDDETLGGLGDLFDEALADVTASHAASHAATKTAEPEVDADEALEPEGVPSPDDDEAPDPHGTSETPGASGDDEADFLDDAAIDDELLSSVEDVLSELDQMESSEEELFGLHSELGAPQRAPRKREETTEQAPAFPDVQPVDPAGARADEHAVPAPAVATLGRPRGGLLPILAVLAANVVLLLFAWSASRSLQAGLRDVRDELDLVRTTAVAADGTRAVTRTDSGAVSTRTEPLATGAGGAHDVAPLPTFDQIALEIAQRELERGLYTSARRRLYGVLALADRIEPERREDVEARLGFMIADSYRSEAEKRREVPQ